MAALDPNRYYLITSRPALAQGREYLTGQVIRTPRGKARSFASIQAASNWLATYVQVGPGPWRIRRGDVLLGLKLFSPEGV